MSYRNQSIEAGMCQERMYRRVLGCYVEAQATGLDHEHLFLWENAPTTYELVSCQHLRERVLTRESSGPH